MPAQTLTPDEAATLLSILHSVAGPVIGLRGSATETLEAIAGTLEIPTAPYVGLVLVNSGGVAEHVCGEVALVQFDELEDEENPTEPAEIQAIADRIEAELGDPASGVVAELRELAHQHRVEQLHNGRVGECTAEQLDAAMQSADIEPSEVRVLDAVVRPA